MRPLNNNVIVGNVEAKTEHVSDGGIVLTRDLEYPTASAEVLAVSPDVDATINVGDTVVFGKHEGVPYQINTGEVVRVLDVSKIYMII